MKTNKQRISYLSINLLLIIFLFSFDATSAQNWYPEAELLGRRGYRWIENPVDIAASQNFIYLLDTDYRGYGTAEVLKFHKNGDLIDSFDVEINSDFSREITAMTLSVDHKGFIYINDPVRGEVKKYSPYGDVILKWGWKNREDSYSFKTASDIFIDHSGFIHIMYVNTFDDCRIKTFSNEGELLEEIDSVPFGSKDFTIEGFLVDKQGNYYGRDQSDSNVLKVNSKGEVIKKWNYQGIPLCFGNNDHLYVLTDKKLVKFSIDGEIISQWEEKNPNVAYAQFNDRLPVKAAIAENGMLYVLNLDGKGIQTFYFLDEDVARKKSKFHLEKQKEGFEKVIDLLNEEKLRSTIRELKAIIQKMPDNSAVYYYLGLCYAKKEKYDLALQRFEEALEINPYIDDAYYQIGRIEEMQGNRQKALKYYDKCISYNGQHSLAHYKLGLILFDLKNYERSRRELEASFWYPEMLDTQSLYTVSMILGMNEARNFREPLGSKYRSLDDVHDYYLAQKFRPYSDVAYKITLNILDFYRFNVGQSPILKKMLHRAEKYLTKAIEAKPESLRGYIELGELYYNYFLLTEDTNYQILARQQFELAVKTEKLPQTPDEYTNFSKLNYRLGLLLIEENKFREAIKYLEKAEQYYVTPMYFFSMLPPDWGNLIHFYLGVCYEKLEENDRAIEYYRKAIESHSLHLSPYIRIGILYARLGQIERAIYEWELGARFRQSYNKYEQACLYHLIGRGYAELFKREGKPIPTEVTKNVEEAVTITNETEEFDFMLVLIELYCLTGKLDSMIADLEKARDAEQNERKRDQMSLKLFISHKTRNRKCSSLPYRLQLFP